MNYRKSTIAQLKKGDRYHFLPSSPCFEFIEHTNTDGVGYTMIRLDTMQQENGYMPRSKEVFVETETVEETAEETEKPAAYFEIH